MSHLSPLIEIVRSSERAQLVITGIMVTPHKSPEAAAREDLQSAITQHRDAIQLALKR